jgi:hypothetical protein
LGRRSRVKHAFEVHRRRAHGALTGLEIGKVPYVHSEHERPLGRDIEETAQELELIVFFHISGGVLCAPGNVSAPNSVIMIGLPKA